MPSLAECCGGGPGGDRWSEVMRCAMLSFCHSDVNGVPAVASLPACCAGFVSFASVPAGVPTVLLVLLLLSFLLLLAILLLIACLLLLASCCCCRPFLSWYSASCWRPCVGVPAVAFVPALADVPVLADVPALAGVLSIVSVLTLAPLFSWSHYLYL